MAAYFIKVELMTFICLNIAIQLQALRDYWSTDATLAHPWLSIRTENNALLHFVDLIGLMLITINFNL